MKRQRKLEENDGGVSSVFPILDEGCISRIISLTTPKEACRASTVSWGFKSASESDTVWEGFLPADCEEIISRSVNPPVNYATKKELFFQLCDYPILIDDRKLSFWLSKSSGKKCYMLRARELSIAWLDTPNHWGWTSIFESRFSEGAELRSVFWLDIQGKMPAQMLSLETTYAAYLVYKIAENSHGLEVGAKASVTFTEATSSVSNTTDAGIGTDRSARISLLEREFNFINSSPSARRRWHRRRYPQRRLGGWMEIFLGEFYNDAGEGDIEIKLFETKILNWKRGLILEGIELRPKECA